MWNVGKPKASVVGWACLKQQSLGATLLGARVSVQYLHPSTQATLGLTQGHAPAVPSSQTHTHTHSTMPSPGLNPQPLLLGAHKRVLGSRSPEALRLVLRMKCVQSCVTLPGCGREKPWSTSSFPQHYQAGGRGGEASKKLEEHLEARAWTVTTS